MSEDQMLCKLAALEANLDLIQTECNRLTRALKESNAGFEEYERRYYLEKQKLEAAVELIGQYGCVDGSHHKQWVLDQVLRVLLPENQYDEWVLMYEQEYPDGPDDMYDEWDVGIAP